MAISKMLGLMVLGMAYVLLIPGITEPVLHMTTTLDKGELTVLGKEAILASGSIPNFLMPMTLEVFNQIQVSGSVVIQDSAKSILGTAQGLWQEGHLLVAVLIVFFSVVIPTLKIGFLAVAYSLPKTIWSGRFALWSGGLSKWSMADVFVMALFVSFLAIKASGSNSLLIQTDIQFENGFYYFLGYCLLSIFASQLLARETRETNTKA